MIVFRKTPNEKTTIQFSYLVSLCIPIHVHNFMKQHSICSGAKLYSTVGPCNSCLELCDICGYIR